MNNNILKTNLSPSQGDHRGSFFKSSVVLIGSTPLGGDYPIRIQSMTNTDTLNTKASVSQCIRIIEAGADYVRLTAQGIREAENLLIIKKELQRAAHLLLPIYILIQLQPKLPPGSSRR
jgi:(E)-4-hydroxy-3-methylbut-2-enyl-diphosphate synthase